MVRVGFDGLIYVGYGVRTAVIFGVEGYLIHCACFKVVQERLR